MFDFFFLGENVDQLPTPKAALIGVRERGEFLQSRCCLGNPSSSAGSKPRLAVGTGSHKLRCWHAWLRTTFVLLCVVVKSSVSRHRMSTHVTSCFECGFPRENCCFAWTPTSLLTSCISCAGKSCLTDAQGALHRQHEPGHDGHGSQGLPRQHDAEGGTSCEVEVDVDTN